MRRIEPVDLSDLDPETLALPAAGERLLRDSEINALALRLRASGARTWITFASVHGKTVRRTIGDAAMIPIAAARALAGSIAGDPAAFPSSAPFPASASLAMVMDAYLASGLGRRWIASTGRVMRGVARHHIIPALGKHAVRDLTRADVLLWHHDLARRTRCERMALSTLSGMLRYAEDLGLRAPGSNPCRGLRKKSSSDRGCHLPAAMVRRLWQTLDTYQEEMPDACDAIRLLLLTGARKREILDLHWSRIEGMRAVLETSKTGPRTIWLNTPSRALLDRRQASGCEGLVFPAPRRAGGLSSIDRQWNVIRRAVEVPTLRIHDLRHHYAAVGVSIGIDLKLIGGLLGHHDIDSTLIYAHLPTSSLLRSANRVSGLIGEATGHGRPPGKGSRQRRRLCARPEEASRQSVTSEASHA